MRVFQIQDRHCKQQLCKQFVLFSRFGIAIVKQQLCKQCVFFRFRIAIVNNNYASIACFPDSGSHGKQQLCKPRVFSRFRSAITTMQAVRVLQIRDRHCKQQLYKQCVFSRFRIAIVNNNYARVRVFQIQDRHCKQLCKQCVFSRFRIAIVNNYASSACFPGSGSPFQTTTMQAVRVFQIQGRHCKQQLCKQFVLFSRFRQDRHFKQQLCKQCVFSRFGIATVNNNYASSACFPGSGSPL